MGTSSGVSSTSTSAQPSVSQPSSTSEPPSPSTVAPTLSSPVSTTIDTFLCKFSEIAVVGISDGVGGGKAQDCWCNFDGGSNSWTYGGIPGDKCCDNNCNACTKQCRDVNQGVAIEVVSRRNEPTPGKDRPRQISNKNSRRDLIAKSLAPAAIREEPRKAVEHWFDIRELKDRTKLWQDYAKKGQQYYNDWKIKTGDDVQNPCDFDEYFNTGKVTHTAPRGTTRTLLDNNDDSVEKVYYAWSASGPKTSPKPIANFVNTMSGSAGVFLALDNSRGDAGDPNLDPPRPPGPTIPWHFSEVAWWMWQRAVLTENPKEPDYSNIKSFWRRDIKNKDTIAILDEAFAGKDTSQKRSWSPNDGNDSAFWPLLGSPNGNGIQYFLTDHKVATKGRGITKISALKADGYYQMWATIKPANE